ncbi:hypothetical protein BKA66DRAFT_607275 [Pyrenochaeta sp. MPI-SDFR-AT-0127]|nr:hypothetical protein BKA66DRAFT_607275 [Pyrenochaeta sp. MPI-SDFR-AT-0127]
MAKKSPSSYYAIHLPAHHRGVYNTWQDAHPRVQKQGRAEFKKFRTHAEAIHFSQHGHESQRRVASSEEAGPSRGPLKVLLQAPKRSHTVTSSSRISIKMECEDVAEYRLNEVENGEWENGEDIDLEDGLARFYAIAKGRKPGIYEFWDEDGGAKEQVHRFSDPIYQKFDDRSAAVDYMNRHGIPLPEIRYFRKTFKQQLNFVPQPTASFNDEFKRFASTQEWESKDHLRKAKIDAIRDELIHHCLPGGITIDQEDEEEGIILTEGQTLQIYQEMCRLAGKPVHNDIDSCILELKRRPFVNILDFIDTFRTGERVHTFNDWDKFVKYTFDGRIIDVKYAKENEFLAPLLQNLRKGPGIIDPTNFRRDFVAKRAARLREREKNAPAVKHEILSGIVQIPCLSPSASEFSPSPSPPPTSVPLLKFDDLQSSTDNFVLPFSSPAPVPDFMTQILYRSASGSEEPDIKLEQSSQAMPKAPTGTAKLAQVSFDQEAAITPIIPPSTQRPGPRKRKRNRKPVEPSHEQSGAQTVKRRKKRNISKIP